MNLKIHNYSTKAKFLFFFLTLFYFVFPLKQILATDDSLSASSFKIEIKVIDDSEVERNKAFGEALKQVLIQSGVDVNSLSSSSAFKAKLNKAVNYVRSYTYLTKNDMLGRLEKFLVVQFDPKAINDLISQYDKKTQTKSLSSSPSKDIEQNLHTPLASLISVNNLSNYNPPILYREEIQSKILIWLVILGINPGSNYILDDSNYSDISISLRKYSQQANFELMFPTMDLEDMYKVTADDICSLNANIIKPASARYNTKSILIGCIAQTGSNKQGQWLLLNNDKQYNWNISGANDDAIMQQIVADVGKILASKSVLAKSELNDEESEDLDSQNDGEVTVDILNVGDLNKYTEVLNYLKNIKIISNVELLSINSASIKLKITCKGGKYALIKELNGLLPQRLIQNNNADIAAVGVYDGDLLYSFR